MKMKKLPSEANSGRVYRPGEGRLGERSGYGFEIKKNFFGAATEWLVREHQQMKLAI